MPTRLPRTRPDRCPGVTRPWPAADGGLVRVRLAGGRLPARALRALTGVAATYGDGVVHLTGRANLQLRGLPLVGGRLPEEVAAAVEATGLLPSRSHELARNLMASPTTGLAGGRTDLRPPVAALDHGLCADPALAALPGRFLFVLDDGRGDLHDAPVDLGLVALDAETAQLRVGRRGWGPVIPITEAPKALLDLARRFLDVRGTGSFAAWHVDELDEPLLATCAPDPRALVTAEPLPYGAVPGGVHVPAPHGVLDRTMVIELVLRAGDRDLVVTPWRGVLVPGDAR